MKMLNGVILAPVCDWVKFCKRGCTIAVLYDVVSDVDIDAFMPHSHPGGECYVVLEEEVWDEDGLILKDR